LQKRVHAGIFLGGPQALQTTRYAHDASRIHINEHFMIAVIEGLCGVYCAGLCSMLVLHYL
jgi:hypothetical protein